MNDDFPPEATVTATRPPRQLPPQNYIALSIIFLSLCSPFALVSLYFGAKVNNFFIHWQDEEARKASNRALLWCWMSAAWVIFIVFICVFASVRLMEALESWSEM